MFFIVAVYNVLVHGNYFLLGDLNKMNNDDVKYIRSALTFIKSGMLTYQEVNKPTVFIMPGITFILVPFIKIFGLYGGLTAFRIFQAILQTFSMILLFFIVREILNSKLALITILIEALYIPEIYNVGTILTEIEFKFLLYLLVYVSIIALKTKETKLYVLGGILLGAHFLFMKIIYP